MDFTKRKPIRVDHETGALDIPGVGKLPLVGPTSGSAYREFQNREAEMAELSRMLESMLAKYWRCSRCRRVWTGRQAQLHRPELNPNVSTVLEFVVKYKPMCPSKRCQENAAKTNEFPELVETHKPEMPA
jgi:hypothetical protein